MKDEVGDDTLALTGPYTFEGAQDEDTWQISRRPGDAGPSTEQIAFAARLMSMVQLLRDVKGNRKVNDKITTLKLQGKNLIFSTLVRENHDDMAKFTGDADAFEARLSRNVARPVHRRSVIIRQSFAFFFAFLGAVLGFFAAENETLLSGLAVDATHLDNLIFLFCGASLGRCVGLLISFYSRLDTVLAYRNLQEDLAHPLSAALNDVVMAIVAYMVFSTGFIVLTFGGDGANGGMSSAQVDDSYPMALIFGLVVGIARAGFLQRLSDTANQTSKGAE